MPTSRWPRVKLTEAASVQRGLLERETSGRVSVNSFIGQYIPVLNFPVDVTGALSKGEINLREATQLARLTPELLDATPARSRRLRSEVMLAHTLARGSQNALRTRIKEILGEVVTDSGKEMAGVVEKIDELLDIDPSDKRHLFYEELKWFFYALRETMPEDMDDDSLDEFMTAAHQLSKALYKIELKRRRREKSA